MTAHRKPKPPVAPDPDSAEELHKMMAIKLTAMQFCSEHQDTVGEIIERSAMVHAWGAQEEVGPRALAVMMVAAKDKRTPMLVVMAPPAGNEGRTEASIQDIQNAIDSLTDFKNELRAKLAATRN